MRFFGPAVLNGDPDALGRILKGVRGAMQFSHQGLIDSLVFSDIDVLGLDLLKNVEVRPMPHIGMATHIGDRGYQQDMGFVLEATLPDGRRVRIAIVADGHYNQGDGASYLSISLFTIRFLSALISLPELEVSELIRFALLETDGEIQRLIEDGGSTFTAFVEVGDEKYIANIGDSRTLFLSPEKEYAQVTINHAVWSYSSFAGRHGYAFLRDLGNRDGRKFASLTHLSAEPDIFVPATPITGGLVFLVSDGIVPTIEYDAYSKDPAASPQSVADRMIAMMLDKWIRNKDNMTAIVLPAVLP